MILKTPIYSIILIVLFNESLCFTNQTTIDKCVNHKGVLPKSIYIQGCETAPCVVQRNQNVSMAFEFILPRSVESMRILATGYLNVLHIPVRKTIDLGDYEAACEYLINTQCPIEMGTLAQFSGVIRIDFLNSIPKDTKAAVEFYIVDENNEPLMCARVPVVIQ